jgi:pimeloyl-[acyl-carrier protein] synthase
MSLDFNPFLPEMRDDPYPTYRRLREQDPVHFSSVIKSWVLTRHADVVSFFSDHEQLSSDRTKAAKWKGGPRGTSRSFQSDGEPHAQLRTLVTKAFSPRVIDRMRVRVTDIIDSLLDRFDGEADLIAGFARPLPMTVISEILGVPATDHEKFHRWGLAFAESTDHAYKGQLGGPNAGLAMARYFAELVPARRKRPRDDLITELIETSDGGDRLTEAEVISTLVSLLFAGHETTVNLIGNGMLSLLRNPDEFERVRSADVGRTTVEEMLRYESPAQIISRTAVEDVVIGDKQIKTRDSVIGLLGAANRDPEVYDDPESLDVGRNPNPHVAFGHGVHFCIGAMLSRLEGRIAIPALVRRLPDMKLVDERADWRETAVLRGLNSLRVTL